jgi:hypothetical protein
MDETEALNDPTPVSFGLLARVLRAVGGEVGKDTNRRLAPLASRLASIETRAAALAMLMVGKRASAEAFTGLEEVLARLDAQAARIAALESQLARKP